MSNKAQGYKTAIAHWTDEELKRFLRHPDYKGRILHIERKEVDAPLAAKVKKPLS